MENIKDLYTAEHRDKISKHLYPTEWVVRTMLGSYPDLSFNKDSYNGGKILDLGFGDGRNFQLLKNIGLNIYGVEITEEILNLVKLKLDKDINVNFAVGSNINIPFENNFFDIVLASSSIYYIDKGTSFNDNLTETSRVLKQGGVLIANLPELTKNFLCQNANNIGDNHIIIKNDPHGLRNGYTFRAFESKEEIIESFSPFYKDICIGYLHDLYFGYELSSFIVVATRK